MNDEQETVETTTETETTFTGELVTTAEWLALPSGAFLNLHQVLFVERRREDDETQPLSLTVHPAGYDINLLLHGDDALALRAHLVELTSNE